MKKRMNTHKAALATVLWLAALFTPASAQEPQFLPPTGGSANHFVLVVPQGEIPFAKAFGLPAAPEPGRGRRIAAPRVVTLVGTPSPASQITLQWLSSTFPVQPDDLLLLQLNSQGSLVRQYHLRSVIPIQWSITGFDAGDSKTATETLVLYCAGGVQVESVSP